MQRSTGYVESWFHLWSYGKVKDSKAYEIPSNIDLIAIELNESLSF